jgi:hypothetical protein
VLSSILEGKKTKDIRRQTSDMGFPAGHQHESCESYEPSEPSYNMFGRGRLKDLSLLDLSPLQHEHAFGIMVIGAIEDIPLNHV